ncbi:MAG: AAA family ATPase, partial [Opitutaceae bacterium]
DAHQGPRIDEAGRGQAGVGSDGHRWAGRSFSRWRAGPWRPRAAQFLILGAKARALLRGRAHVTAEDIQALALPTLRHRILLNYRAEAEGVRVEDVIQRLVAAAKAPLANG